MAEAERIIGTPDSPETGAAEPDKADPAGQADAAAGRAPERAEQEEREERDGQEEKEPQEAVAERPRGRRRIAVLFAVAALAYVLDLVSKLVVVAKLEHRESIEILGDWLQLEVIRNPGAAWGVGEAFTIIFTLIATAVIVVIVRLARKLYSLPWAIALGLLLGGALGNLTDRIFRSPGVFEGAVVDFIAPKNYPVFNLADSAIVCGGILIVLLSFRGVDPDGTVHKD
ncbi:signal peptidase II [Streptomyces sp. SID5785]|uniref:signal peptidase II n=1 Tax=Streptomyces sp. SID5785 TaxID=2690309 RepID=UPI001361BBCF|nr:signal peptidase II [Streptomyces sp. SID5785]